MAKSARRKTGRKCCLGCLEEYYISVVRFDDDDDDENDGWMCFVETEKVKYFIYISF